MVDRGRGEIAVCPSKPSYPNYNHDVQPDTFDLGEARRLLAEAGWRDTDGDGWLDRDGQRLEFALNVPEGRLFYAQITAQLQESAAQVGVRVVGASLSWASFVESLEQRSFDAACLFNSFSDPWIDAFEDLHSSRDAPGRGNLSGWHNAVADRLLEQMQVEPDDARRDAQFKELCAVFNEEQPISLLTHGRVSVLLNRRYEDAAPLATGLAIQRFWVKPENRRVP